MLLFEMFSASSAQMGLTKNRAKAGCWCNSSFFNTNPGDFSFSLHSPSFLSAARFLQLLGVAAETGVAGSEPHPFSNLQITSLRTHKLQQESKRRPRSAFSERALTAEFRVSCSVPILTSCDFRSWEKNMTPGEEEGRVHCLFHHNQSERDETNFDSQSM